MSLKRWGLFLSEYWRAMCTVGIPLLLLPLPLVLGTPASECAYVLLLMATFWMLELLPLAVTPTQYVPASRSRARKESLL